MRSINVTSVIGIALLFFVISIPVEAQIFPASGPMPYNGGFAGESGKQRLVSATQVDMSSYEKVRTQFRQTFSYDAFIPSLQSGIGVTAGFRAEHFKPMDSMNWELRNPYFSIAVSPKISFGGKLTLAPFVDFQFVHSRNTNYFHRNRVDPPMIPTNSRYTLRLGLLLNSEKGYVGLTFVPFEKARVDEPMYSYRFATHSYPGAESTKLMFQAGRTFQRKNETDPKFSFTPQVALAIYRLFNSYDLALVDLNVAFRFNRFHTGIGAGGLQFAYDWDNLRVATGLIFYRLYRRSGYQTFINGQLTIIKPYQYFQIVSVRYLIGEKSIKMGGRRLSGN